MNKSLLIGVVAILVIGGGWWYFNQKSEVAPIETVQESTQTTPSKNTNTQASQTAPVTSTKDYTGEWFKVSYPANFSAKKEGPDEASFTSPQGDVHFYVYSPQWSGDPVSYLNALPTEKVESDTSTPTITPFTNQYGTTYDKKITRYITFVAKDGSYKRSLVSITAGSVTSPDSEDYASKTHMVFGIKYKDQVTYDTYLNQYLAFKKSLVQYAD